MNQRGFSLLELMTVVCIIGVLTMVAMTEYFRLHDRAYIGAALSDVQVFRKALSMYDAEWGQFPPDPAGSMEELLSLLVDPRGETYMSSPSGENFSQLLYVPGDPVINFGDYSLTVVCKDHSRTTITVHSSERMERQAG